MAANEEVPQFHCESDMAGSRDGPKVLSWATSVPHKILHTPLKVKEKLKRKTSGDLQKEGGGGNI